MSNVSVQKYGKDCERKLLRKTPKPYKVTVKSYVLSHSVHQLSMGYLCTIPFNTFSSVKEKMSSGEYLYFWLVGVLGISRLRKMRLSPTLRGMHLDVMVMMRMIYFNHCHDQNYNVHDDDNTA